MKYYDYIVQIDELISHYTEKNINLLSSLIQKNKELKDYFLKEIKSIEWFKWLNNNNYFRASEIDFDKDGNALFWNVLPYLERVSLQIGSLDSKKQTKYSKELIKIIDDTVDYSLKLKEEKSRKKINHFHIWWYFVKIINNIPTELIVKESLFSIEQFKKWLFEFMDPEIPGDLPVIDIAEKLLPKFLDNKDTVKFAEVIIDVITAIKKGGRKRLLINRDEAILVYSSSSYWILDAFKKHSRKIGEVCSTDIIYTLADRLELALEYKQQDFFVDLEVENNRYRIRIERVPEEDLKEDEIGFKENTYTIVIKQFSQKQLREIDFDKDIWIINIPEPEKFISRFSIVAENKQSFMEQIKSKLPSDINWQKAEDFSTRINNLFDGLYEDYSQVWCKSLDKESEHPNDADDILTIILKNILLSKCETDKESGNRVLKDFLSDKYKFPIFKRFVILCIDKLWENYQELLKEVLERIPDVLEEPDCEVEIFDLLKNHHNELDPEEIILKLKELIERIPQYYREKNLEDYWRYKWYSPLKDNKEFKDLYVKAKEKVRPKDDKPYEPEHTSFKGGLITHKSPLSKEKILEMPIAELVKFLGEFKGADFWEGTFEGKPDKQGLAETLREAVKENPEKFVKEIDLFYNAPYFYVNHLFWGLRDAFNAGKDFTPLWGEIFRFSLKYVKKPTLLKEAFESQRGDSGRGKYISVVEGIVDLIKAGSKDDSKTFSPQYFDIVKQIFGAVTPLPKVELHPDTQRDALTYALNTTFGRIVRSFIVFSLRVRRVTKQEEKDWGKNNYEWFFERQGVEAWIWFGHFLPNIRYLDKKYAEDKINEFLEYDTNDFRWQVFMEGYLTGPYVYDDIYKLMRPHYKKAIENKVLPEDIDYRLVQHICIGYLRGYELLERKNKDGEDSLFWKMLEGSGVKEKHDRWLEVVNFFWDISGRRIEERKKEDRDRPSENVREKVLQFWKWTFDKQEYVKEKLGEDYERFLAQLADLTIYLDRIDEENKEWLMLSAPCVYKEHYTSFFIEYLTKFEDDDSVKHLGKIFLKILEDSTPTYRQEDIQLIVERLYKLWQKDKEKYKKIKEDADEICNTYGRRGIHFLKGLWAKYNNS